MMCCHNNAKVFESQVRTAQRLIIYFREGIERQNREFVLQALERDHLHEGRDIRNQTASQPSQGAETWFYHHPILLQVILRSVLRGLMLKGLVV